MTEQASPEATPSKAPPGTAEAREAPSVAPQTWALLRGSKLFWSGLAFKLVCAALFGSHFATRWFAPFLYDFVHGRFADPWAHFLARHEPYAFPYGPGMLGLLALPWLPALGLDFDPSGHVGLFLLRLPLIAADLAVLALLMRWLRVHAEDAVRLWWLNPIVFYATYIHGQLDLLPTALLCGALYLLFDRKLLFAALLFGLALATKGHLLLCLPFVLVFLYRQRLAWPIFGTLALAVGTTPYVAMLPSAAFRLMVLENPESRRFWTVAIPYGPQGIALHASLAALALIFFRFASYRRIDRELTFTFIGLVYLLVVSLTPPQPGWYIWSLPFVVHAASRLTRTGRAALTALALTYLASFFVAQPDTFLGALDPTFGARTGHALIARLAAAVPWLFTPRSASALWSVLFAISAVTAFEIYRVGVRGRALYHFLDATFMLGIGGDSGAGKHTLCRDLHALLGRQFTSINGDDDHRWERGHAMWRRHTHLDPRANHLIAQVEALATLRRGGEVRKRHYDHSLGRFTEPVRVEPSPFLAIVGLHPFYIEQQRKLLHLKVFVDTDESLRRKWKVARDVKARGYAPERVYAEIERRMADSARFVQPQKRYADVVIRHLLTENEDPRHCHLQAEVASSLLPLQLLDALGGVEGLTVEWSPDETLTRDTFTIQGEVDADTFRALASAAIPNVAELLDEDGWQPGGRGAAQLVLLHAISARLRAHGEE
jgi:uridine kinase